MGDVDGQSKTKPPAYMAHLLEALGWNKGTRIPLADQANQELETQLIDRQNELQKLKEVLTVQKQKRQDLNNYMAHVNSESQENTRLIFAHKQQMEQEVKLRQLCKNEADGLDRDIIDTEKQSKDITTRIDRLQSSINRLLKKADTLKVEVCGERGVLQEWRAALERYACDITAVEQFTKMDLFKAKELETQRQKLKMEHDRMHERLVQLMSNLAAEERACDRISIQVVEGMAQRKEMMTMWTSAVENLRQRDTDIRHIREDYAILEAEANRLAEQCREQQAFWDQQRGNNLEAQRENMNLGAQLGHIRMSFQRLADSNVTLDSEIQSLQRELSHVHNVAEKLHMENKAIVEEQIRKNNELVKTEAKIKELKLKVTESLDKSKSSEKRARELQDMLNEEERYASQTTTSQQRAMHCSFIEQQKLLALENEEKLYYMRLKASKAIVSKLDSKQRALQKLLQTQKEALYTVCYQVETIGARVAHMEGQQAERECSADLVEKENRIKNVHARHAARVSLLERHLAKLHDDMRRLAREVENKSQLHTDLQSRLKTALLNVEGGEKELVAARDGWRRLRVDEALLRLRVAHASRALQGLDDTAFNLDEQRLQINAAMDERHLEIKARRDMFIVQKRALLDDCGKLNSEIRERESRIAQLIKSFAVTDHFHNLKSSMGVHREQNEELPLEVVREWKKFKKHYAVRYDIFVASLGKDDSGQQLTVTYFKVKFAAERAELRERGAALDADIGRRERDVSALEATLRVVHVAHQQFMYHISPLSHDAPEIQELNSLMKQYYDLREEYKVYHEKVLHLEQYIADAEAKLEQLTEKNKNLVSRQSLTETELEQANNRMQRQKVHLHKAREIVRHNAKRAKKLVEGQEDWRIFQMALWNRDYSDAAFNTLNSLWDLCQESPALALRFSAIVASTDLPNFIGKSQRRLQHLMQKILAEKTESKEKKESLIDVEESVFSTSISSVRSGVSIASGYTKRLAGFRRHLAPKVGEDALIDEIPETARRSTVSLRVITLGLEETTSSANRLSPRVAHSKKSIR